MHTKYPHQLSDKFRNSRSLKKGFAAIISKQASKQEWQFNAIVAAEKNSKNIFLRHNDIAKRHL
jgi:hypothetical protein